MWYIVPATNDSGKFIFFMAHWIRVPAWGGFVDDFVGIAGETRKRTFPFLIFWKREGY